jgi:replicative DNA helicase
MSNPNLTAQEMVVVGLFHHGKTFLERTRNILTDGCFDNPKWLFLYQCFTHIILQQNLSIDCVSINNYADITNQHSLVSNKLYQEYLPHLRFNSIQLNDAIEHARYLRRNVEQKKLSASLKTLAHEVESAGGYTPMLSITRRIYDFLSKITLRTMDGDSRRPEHIGIGLEKDIQDRLNNPVQHIGLSTGYALIDEAIGGLRPGSVTVIGSRIKTGKTTLLTNIGMNVANTGVPVLFLDIEMVKEEVVYKILAREARVDIGLIETGRACYDEEASKSLLRAAKKMESAKDAIPFDYINIADMSSKEFLSVVEEWVIQRVGLDENGHAKECLVLLDYLSLTVPDLKDTKSQEYQQIGQLMAEISSIAVRYKMPFISTVQLNRDGIEDETGKAMSQSDRILWKCTSFLIFKAKTDKEMSEDNWDGINKGNRKIVQVLSRFAKECDRTNYIAIDMKGNYATITETGRKWEFKRKQQFGDTLPPPINSIPESQSSGSGKFDQYPKNP